MDIIISIVITVILVVWAKFGEHYSDKFDLDLKW